MTKEASLYSGEKTVSSISEKTTATCKRMKLEHFLTLYTKIKWINDLNVGLDIIKLWRGKHRQNTLWHKLKQYFFGSTSYNNENKNKNKRDLIKLKSFCIAKETVIKTKKTNHRMGENICKWSHQQGTNL